MVEMDATPVVAALLDAAGAVLGKGVRKALAAVLPEIRVITVKHAQSLAFDSMEEANFRLFFDGITAWIGAHHTQVMLDEVRGEY
jgi:L-alanine-DL-glutamate epimerase-like enolase superfamily enzyme